MSSTRTQLLQFHLLFSVQIIFWLLLSSIVMFILIEPLHMSVAEWNDMHVFTTEGFLEVATESCAE